MPRPRLMDVTLRDGGYVINFQFTAADTAALCRELDAAGFDLIEVGHGIGLGAQARGLGDAAESDEAYLKAAAENVTRAEWGCFCIPGVSTLDQIDMAAGYGMDFVRIGTNVSEVEQSEPFIRRAKARGLTVCANFMKSYTLPPEDFAQRARLSESYGADIVYVVDSAGGMMTHEMAAYVAAVRAVSRVGLGFHGHNNLGLAVANSLRAIELGVDVIDVSLQGMGRSAGNTPTEQLLLVLQRTGHAIGVDPLRAIDIGQKLVRPLITKAGYDGIDMVSGYAQFHSSYMKVIREFSSKYKVDPRRLIIALCEKDKVDAPRALVEALARDLANTSEAALTASFRFDQYHGSEQDPRDPPR